jgi:perosamine synthetase
MEDMYPGSPDVAQVSGSIPLAVPNIAGNEWKYVKECLDTSWVSSVGSYVGRFESEIAGYVGVKHGIATSSGTAALHTALLVAGIGRGDEVLVSTLTFIAPANAVRYVGATPIFIDADPGYWQMDPERVLEFIESECSWDGTELRNKATGGRVCGILPVHILGHPVDMDSIVEIAARYGLIVIEDASESLGVRYKGRMTGSIGHIACFSFNGNKIITSGGGGMIVTNDDDWARRAKHLTTQAKADDQEYIHDEVGYNYRLTNIQAALGCAQMEQLSKFIAAKRDTAALYMARLRKCPGITCLSEASWASSTYWLFTIRLSNMDRRVVAENLALKGIQTRPLWQPIHMSPCHQTTSRRSLPVSEALYRECISLPCSSGITHEQISIVADALWACAG